MRAINIWKATASLGLAMLLTRAVNFLTQVVIARQFGASIEADAYFIVENIMLILGSFVLYGFSAAYIPLWMEYRAQQGIAAARRLTGALFRYANAAAGVLTAACALAAALLIWLSPPGDAGRLAQTAGQLLLVMSPSVAFLGLTAGCTGMLQANRRFIIPELSFAAHNLLILAAAGFAGTFGILALAWAAVFASLARLLVQAAAALRANPFRMAASLRHPGVRQVQKRMLPIFLAYAGTQVTLLIGSLLASGLAEGSVSGLFYASRVMLLPVGMIVLPLQTVLFPTLSQHAAQKQPRALAREAARGLRWMALITIPLCAGLVLLRGPLIQLFYQRGAFDAASTALAAGILGWYALALPATAGLMLVSSIYCSLGEPAALVKFNLVNWAGAALFGAALMGRSGAEGVAAGSALAASLACAVALAALGRRLPGLDLRALAGAVLKILCAGGVMAACLLGANAVLPSLPAYGTAGAAAAIAWNAVLGAAVFTAAAFILRVDEALAAVQTMGAWVRRQRRAER